MLQTVILTQSPKSNKKFRIQFADTGKTVDFGASGYSDYTIHKDPLRMREYVRRHGGQIPKWVLGYDNPSSVQLAMLRVKKSTKENWTDPHTAGFWSRWLLWSFPSTAAAKKYLRGAYEITIKNR